MTAETDVRGKDTWRLREAGAARVLWLIAQPEAVERGLKKALGRLKSSPGVVMEGNAAASLVKADLVVMVRRRAGDKMTASARAAEELPHQTFIFDEGRVGRECKRWARSFHR
jgi:molybdopterin-guanine dinucleotide biosynthesis protein